MKRVLRSAAVISVLAVACVVVWEARAASLSFVSDLISSSAPSAASNHTVQFTATNAIPASGSITVVPQAGSFTIPAGFSASDVDIATASGSGSFIERALASSASATEDGVSFVTGSSGSVTITLNSSDGIEAGERVRILLGTHAAFGGTGSEQIANPGTTGSYRLVIETKDSGGGLIDRGRAMVAIVAPVAAGAEVVSTGPFRFNGLPSGEIAAGNSQIEISLNTGSPGICRYSLDPGVSYASMTNIFSTTGGTLHAAVIGGHQDDTSYTYYVRCIGEDGVANVTDFPISFSLKETPPEPGSAGSGGSGGIGPVPQGSAVLFLSSVVLSGHGAPQNTLSVLMDGVQHGTVTTGGDGSFQYQVSSLERGTYSFIVRAQDREGRQSAAFSTTLTVVQGTQNAITSIALPPTIALSSESVARGDDARISGESIPGSTVELLMLGSGARGLGEAQRFTATTTQAGRWEVVIETGQMPQGTYGLRARTVLSDFRESAYSSTVFLGIGEDPSPDFAERTDINGDGRVNLVDFSILLSFWGTANPNADVNMDGRVDLSDVSILLFHWTG